MYESAEEKLRMLAAQNAQLIADLTWPNTAGNPTFMWFDRQLAQGDLGKPSQGQAAISVTRVSTIRPCDNQGGVQAMSQPRLQIDVYAYNAEQTREIASHVVAFMNSISLCDAGEFASPQTGPSQNPNRLINERAGMRYQIGPKPVYVETQDWRCFNREDIPA